MLHLYLRLVRKHIDCQRLFLLVNESDPFIERLDSVSGEYLTSSGPLVKKPGESITLSCSASGFYMNNYWMHWIRQKPGSGLEWIGGIYSSSTVAAQSLKDQFLITTDYSNNLLHLEIKSQNEDTAVYFCARGPQFNVKAMVMHMSTSRRDRFPSMLTIESKILLFIFVVILSKQGIHCNDFPLDQSPAVTKKTGENQKPGKALQWIGMIDSGSSISSSGYLIYAESMKNHFTMSEDVSQSTQYLEIKSLKEEDTAYVLPLSQFVPESGSFLTIGCLATGFSPADSLTFSWKDSDGKKESTFVEYPAFGKDGDYTKISHLRVEKGKWDPDKPYTCVASNSLGNKDSLVPAPLPELNGSVFLTAPSKKDLDNGNATFTCLAQMFSPQNHAFKWYRDDVELTTGIDSFSKSQRDGSETTHSAMSILQMDAENWKPIQKIKCVFEHKTGNVEKEVEHTAQECSTVEVRIVPPSTEDMLIKKVGDLTCVASGSPGFKAIEMKVNGRLVSNASMTETERTKTEVVHKVRVNRSDWINAIYTCTVEHKDEPGPKTSTYTRESAWLVWIEHPLYEVFDADDSGITSTAITFIFLFLITLFYSIAATFVKVK
ncbi:hypothetical protein DNTS_028796 [Danionella cerebrum]|uniref:Ig-like domain-containing protein n=1 Tax=Danionella cerebrum TaxID=2873325 RepID=A0A553NMX4_9TELE|nr:hypothetical protein DNTS_028796 [Danionella translucida]